MPAPLPTTPTPVFAASNIHGSPLTTIGGILAAVAGYLQLNGAVMPHNTESWISFAVGLLFAVATSFLKTPGKA